MKEIRLLNAEEIDVRVGGIYEKGITLLLYKDARVDMSILDEVFGPMGWQRHHVMVGEGMLCEVSVKDEKTGEWITKTDLGAPSFSEPLKGAASDSFKRASTNWGIGRELYTAPFIWIPREKVEVREERGKQVVKDSFRVQSISYDANRKIVGLVICNQKNVVVFQKMVLAKQEKATAGIDAEQTAMLLEELKRTGVSLGAVLRKYKLNKISDMSPQLWKKAMEALQNTADREAA